MLPSLIHTFFFITNIWQLLVFAARNIRENFCTRIKSWFTVHARTSVDDCLAVLSVCVYGGLLSHRLYIDKLITCVYNTRGHCLPLTLIIFWEFLVNSSPNTSLIFFYHYLPFAFVSLPMQIPVNFIIYNIKR